MAKSSRSFHPSGHNEQNLSSPSKDQAGLRSISLHNQCLSATINEGMPALAWASNDNAVTLMNCITQS